jgi:dihydroxyacetone kinase DhaKLM complex PTS-EIIA-like component DhaM
MNARSVILSVGCCLVFFLVRAGANELPFGLSPQMGMQEVRHQLAKREFLTLNRDYSGSSRLNYDIVGEFSLSQIEIFDVDVIFVEGKIQSVILRTKTSPTVFEASQRLLRLRNFFLAQGRRKNRDDLGSIRKVSDLERKSPLVTFPGLPCEISLSTAVIQGKPLQLIRYDVTLPTRKRSPVPSPEGSPTTPAPSIDRLR